MEELDLRGLKCPLPALLARRRLAGAPAGTVLLVVTDDPMAPIDVPHMCRGEGFEHLSTEHRGADAHLVLRRP
jgi:tRNA 2-thiouridine synthesizing protein A